MKFRVFTIHHLFQCGVWLLLLVCIVALPSSYAAEVPPDITTFDHLNTGFPLDGEHQNLACEQCHLGGVFNTLPKECNQCHDGVFASGQPPTHFLTNAPCETCHTSTGFTISAQTFFDHGIVNGRCSSGCHDGIGPGQGKPSTHPLTSNACEFCHTYPNWKVLNSPFDHTGVMESSCNRVGCHDASDRNPNHPPVTTDRCERCHTSMGSWIVDPGFDHNLTPLETCVASGCHTQADQRPGHPSVIPLECNVCHITKGRWLPLTLPFDHSQTNQNFCVSSGCHSATEKGAAHPPTSNNCSACHSISNYSWLPVMSPINHDEINTTNCTTNGCHTIADKTTNHPLTSDNCGQCHAAGSWVHTTPFNHDETTDACIRCHSGKPASGKDPGHAGTTDVCEFCHRPGDLWTNMILPFNHDQVTQLNCASADCHSEQDKLSLSGNHPLTSNACESCHQNTSDWTDVAAFNHDFADSCGSVDCHGSAATTQPPTHPLTSMQCQACHVYPSWKPLLPVIDHSQTSDACANCHDGNKAIGKGLNHVNTSLACDSCHTTVSFLNVDFDHSTVAGQSCASANCHDGVSSHTYKAPTHPFTSEICEACHNNLTWLPPLANMDHGETEAACAICHTGQNATNKSDTHPASTVLCEQCHNALAWVPLLPVIDHSQTSAACSICHTSPNARNKSPTHPVTTDACEFCHSTGSWMPLPQIDHAHAMDSCVRCHNGVAARGKETGHPLSSDTCDLCHNTTDWLQISNFHADPLNMVNCERSGCHDSVGATGKSGTHPNTSNTCHACHTYNAWDNLNRPFDHSQTNEVCEVCHNNVIAQGKDTNHIPTVLPCDSCHTATTWLNAFLDHGTVAGLACASAGCHDGVSGGATFKSQTHPLTSNLCDECHATNNWIPRNPINHGETSDLCSNCHNGTIATDKPANHCPTSLACDLCHNTNVWGSIRPGAPACDGTTPGGGGGGGEIPGDNLPPIAVITAPPGVTTYLCNRDYAFDSSGSSDPENQPLVGYQWWVFPQGTGTILTPRQSQTIIRFTTGGAKTIRLTVNDGVQDSAPDEINITVSNMMCM